MIPLNTGIGFRTKQKEMGHHANDAANHGDIPKPFQWILPETDRGRNVRIFWQSAISFGSGDIMQDINHACASNPGWIVHAGVLVPIVLFELVRPFVSHMQHFLF